MQTISAVARARLPVIEVRPLGLGGLLELVPARQRDARGFFSEVWSRADLHAAGLHHDWVQENHSMSASKGVLRGLHYQLPPAAQTKLVRVTRGSIFDVVVDIRPCSATFGQWASLVLSAELWNQLLVPVGFAHGFVTLEENVEVQYKVSAPYRPDLDRAIKFDDPAIAIEWPIESQAVLVSDRDAFAPFLAQAELPERW